MAEQSALKGHFSEGDFGLVGSNGPQVTLSEVIGMKLFQLSVFARQMKEFSKYSRSRFGIETLPGPSTSVRGKSCLIIRAEATKFWVASRRELGTSQPAKAGAYYPTDMTGSKTIVRVAGSSASAILNRMCAVDLTAREGAFLATGMHHVPVHIHCRNSEMFELLIPRSFGLSIMHSLFDISQQFGVRVTAPANWTLPRR